MSQISVFAAGLLWHALVTGASASSISGLAMTNSSNTSEESGGTGIARSFHTGASIESQSALTFSTRFAFQNANMVMQPPDADGPNFANVNPGTAAYRLDRTVLADPTEMYRITVNVVSRGSAVARSDNNIRFDASPLAFSGRFDSNAAAATNTLGVQLSPLTLFANGTSADADPAFSVVDTDVSSPFDAGNFTGTRSMALFFTSFGSPGNADPLLSTPQISVHAHGRTRQPQ